MMEKLKGLLLLLCFVCVAFSQSEGQLKFVKWNNPSFDVFTSNSSARQFLLNKMHRMLTWSPYFDQKTSWYPNSWFYTGSWGVETGDYSSVSQYILKDKRGNILYFNWNCDGNSCGGYAGDISHPEYRSWVSNRIRTIFSQGNYKGVLMSSVTMKQIPTVNASGYPVPPIDRNTGVEMTFGNWQKYMSEFMQYLRSNISASKEIVHQTDWQLNDNSPFVINSIEVADYIWLWIEVSSFNIYSLPSFLSYIDRVHSRGVNIALAVNPPSPYSSEAEFVLAVYFLVNNGNDLYENVQIYPSNWWWILDFSLGDPLGTRTALSNGLISREFTNAIVLVNPTREDITYSSSYSFRDLNNNTLNSVDIAAGYGKVLIRTVPVDSKLESSESTSNKGGMIGGIITAVIVLVAVVAVVVYILIKRRSSLEDPVILSTSTSSSSFSPPPVKKESEYASSNVLTAHSKSVVLNIDPVDSKKVQSLSISPPSSNDNKASSTLINNSPSNPSNSNYANTPLNNNNKSASTYITNPSPPSNNKPPSTNIPPSTNSANVINPSPPSNNKPPSTNIPPSSNNKPPSANIPPLPSNKSPSATINNPPLPPNNNKPPTNSSNSSPPVKNHSSSIPPKVNVPSKVETETKGNNNNKAPFQPVDYRLNLVTSSPNQQRSKVLVKNTIREESFSWEIKYSELELKEELGRGSFGIVYKGLWRGGEVAVKQMANKGQLDEKVFVEELSILSHLRPHPNILQFQGACIEPESPVCLVAEYLPNGNLFKYLRVNKPLTQKLSLKLLRGIAAGMTHLQNEGIVHRDLAARNILLTSDVSPKIADFGMSRFSENSDGNVTSSDVGPLKWFAPESLLYREYSFKSDVWSFGVVIYEVMTCDDPYVGLSPAQAAAQVARGIIKLTIPTVLNIPLPLQDLFDLCMKWDSKLRPDFKEIFTRLKEIDV